MLARYAVTQVHATAHERDQTRRNAEELGLAERLRLGQRLLKRLLKRPLDDAGDLATRQR